MSCEVRYGGLPVKIKPLKHNIKKNKVNNPTLDRAKKVLETLKKQREQL